MKSGFAFKKISIPVQRGYFPSGVIQYNEKTKHFRCIKSLKPWDNYVIDGRITKKIDQEEREKEM